MPKGIKGFQKGQDNPTFGKRPHNFGKHPSKKTLKKQRESHLGNTLTQLQKDKISKANKGRKKPPRSKEHRKKLGDAVRGEKSRFWIDGRASKRKQYSEYWTDYLRDSIRIRDNYVCHECGTHQDELSFGQVKKLDVHHIDYDAYNLNPDNLISLCRSCHMKTNYNREYWLNYFNNKKL